MSRAGCLVNDPSRPGQKRIGCHPRRRRLPLSARAQWALFVARYPRDRELQREIKVGLAAWPIESERVLEERPPALRT